MKNRPNRAVYICLFGLLPCGVVLSIIKESIANKVPLNTKDLKGIGTDAGTVYDYLTNVWVWDGICVGSVFLGIIAFIIGLIVLTESKARIPLNETDP